MSRKQVEKSFRLSDAIWERIEPLLPKRRKSRNGGRPPLPYRQLVDGVFYVLRTGCQWKAAPPEFGSGSSLHRYFQRWVAKGVFETLWAIALLEYDELRGLEWRWQAMDGAMTKAPLGGEKTGPNPTDRAKRGVKRSVLTDGGGIPLGVVVSGANTHDKKLVAPTLESMPVARPEPTAAEPQHLCMDKGYDYPDVRDLVAAWGYTAHIKTRGDKADGKRRIPGYRARRWVVERTHSWFNRFRRLLVRWEKNDANYLALLHFACAYVTYNAAGVLG